MNQNRRDYYYEHWYENDYVELLSDELKIELDIVLNNDIINSFNSSGSPIDISPLINRINRICSKSETKCIEMICQLSKVVYNIDRFIRKYQSVFPFIDKLLNDEEFLLKCISSSSKVFKFIHKVNEQQDVEMILKCAFVNPKVLKHITPTSSIFNDKQLMMKLFQSMNMKRRGKYGEAIFNKLSAELKNDREIVLLAAEKGIPVLCYIDSEELKNDREIVLHSVRNNGISLYRASETTRNDREIVIEAIRTDGNALQFVSNSLQNDREFISEMVTKFKAPLHFASELLQKDRELILASLKNHPSTLSNAPSELLSNREFILECVKVNGCCLDRAPTDFFSDLEIVNEAIKQNPFSIYGIDINGSSSGMDCKNSLLSAVDRMHIKNATNTFQYSVYLRRINDLDIAMKLIEINPFSIHFLNDNIRKNCQELTYKSTLLHNGYWMKHSEDAYQERINHAYYSAKIDSNSSSGVGGGGDEINYYRNVNKTNLKDVEWKSWKAGFSF